MLIVSRAKNEAMIIDGVITITVVEIRGDKVRLGIEAPREASVHRQEVWEAIRRASDYPEPPPARPTPVTPPATVASSSGVPQPTPPFSPASSAPRSEQVASPSAPSLDQAIETLRRAAERLSPEEAAAAKTLLDAAKAKLS